VAEAALSGQQLFAAIDRRGVGHRGQCLLLSAGDDGKDDDQRGTRRTRRKKGGSA